MRKKSNTNMKTKTITLTSNGYTGKQWIAWFEDNGYRVSSWAKEMLNSKDFKPTKGIEYQIAIVNGSDIPEPRTTAMIREYAAEKGYQTPNAEVACLLKQTMSYDEMKEMGLWYIVTMHEPIKDSDGDPLLLDSDRFDDGRWLLAVYDGPDGNWDDGGGFAFAVPQVSSQESDAENSSVPVPLDLEARVKALEGDMEKIKKFLII